MTTENIYDYWNPTLYIQVPFSQVNALNDVKKKKGILKIDWSNLNIRKLTQIVIKRKILQINF